MNDSAPSIRPSPRYTPNCMLSTSPVPTRSSPPVWLRYSNTTSPRGPTRNDHRERVNTELVPPRATGPLPVEAKPAQSGHRKSLQTLVVDLRLGDEKVPGPGSNAPRRGCGAQLVLLPVIRFVIVKCAERLKRKSKFHHVAVLHHVVLALHAHLA